MIKDVFCFYNNDSNTLRIETCYKSKIEGDSLIFQDDPVSTKVFISYICNTYPSNGSNSTHLSLNQIKAIYKDINGYIKTFDKISETYTFEDLLFDENWRVD